MSARNRLGRPQGTIALSVACFLLLHGTAAARAPSLNSAEYKSDALTATWTLPPGVDAFSLEASRSPKLEADGGFDQLDLYKSLKDDATTITVRQRFEREFRLWVLDPGTYYVHVGGSDTDCEPCPTVEYSEIMTVVVTHRFPKDANATCKAYLPFAKRLLRRLRRADTPRQVAAVLDDIAGLIDEVLADLRVRPPPPGSSREARFEAMLDADSRQARYYRRAADALRDGDRSRAIRYLEKGDRASLRAARFARRLNLPACA